MSQSPHISVVVPVYGCEACLVALYTRLAKTLKTIHENFEIILVNDSSPDGAWETICKLADGDNRVKALDLSRNFGQHYAITAGLDVAEGEWVVVMDCDLQDPPEEIPKLYAKVQEGVDIAYGVSPFRGQQGFFWRMLKKAYYSTQDRLSGNDYTTVNLSFVMMSGTVCRNFRRMRESTRHVSVLVRHMGYRIAGVEVEHKEREQGSSSYTLGRRIRLAIDGLLAYSAGTLRGVIYIGFTFSVLSFLYGGYLLLEFLTGQRFEAGWLSIMLALFFNTGIILMVLGIMGLFIDRIYEDVKQRPLYFVRETRNLRNSQSDEPDL